MHSDHTNAVAGPSTFSSTPPPSTMLHPSSFVPPLFLPSPAPPPPKQHLANTQDLLSRFNLLSTYTKYVRTHLLPGADCSNDGAPPSTPGVSTMPGGLGRGKEAVTMGNTPAYMDPGDGGDGDDDDVTGGKGEKKKKNTYRHLIKGISGKHSLKKDDSLTKVMLVPPKQRMRIVHFDLRTQEEVFTVSPEGLKSWNINTLVLESAQAREDRKKRKELKRLAKLQEITSRLLTTPLNGKETYSRLKVATTLTQNNQIINSKSEARKLIEGMNLMKVDCSFVDRKGMH